MFTIKDFFTSKLQGLSVDEIYKEFHINELKTYSKALGIKNRSKMNKADLSLSIYNSLNENP